jgi:hypothetical protein
VRTASNFSGAAQQIRGDEKEPGRPTHSRAPSGSAVSSHRAESQGGKAGDIRLNT